MAAFSHGWKVVCLDITLHRAACDRLACRLAVNLRERRMPTALSFGADIREEMKWDTQSISLTQQCRAREKVTTFWAESTPIRQLPNQVVLALRVLVNQQRGQVPVWVVGYAVVGDDLDKFGPCVLGSQLLNALPHLCTVWDPAMQTSPLTWPGKLHHFEARYPGKPRARAES